jgi:hypothetical protein
MLARTNARPVSITVAQKRNDRKWTQEFVNRNFTAEVTRELNAGVNAIKAGIERIREAARL